jgi:hypothetical protein
LQRLCPDAVGALIPSLLRPPPGVRGCTARALGMGALETLTRLTSIEVDKFGGGLQRRWITRCMPELFGILGQRDSKEPGTYASGAEMSWLRLV